MKHRILNASCSWIMVLTFLATTTPSMYVRQDESPEEQALEAADAISDPVNRLKALKEFLRKYPKSKEIPHARLFILDALLDAKAPAVDLIAACESAVASMPKDFEGAEAFITMSFRVAEVLNNRDEQLEKALEFARKALALLPPDNEQAQNMIIASKLLIGLLLYKSGKVDQAIQQIQNVLAGDVNTNGRAVGWLYLSKSFEKKGDAGHAIDAFIQSIALYGKKIDEAPEPFRTLLKQSEASVRSLYQQRPGAALGFDELIEKTLQESQQKALKLLRYDRVAPEWELNDLAGHTLKSADFKGKIVVLNFWGSWCQYCEEELLQFQKLFERYKGKDVEFVSINVENPAPERVRLQKAKAFLAEHSFTFPVAIDLDHIVAAYYDLQNFPTLFVIDRGGTIRYKNEGTPPELGKRIEREVQTLISAKANEFPSVPPDDEFAEAKRLFDIAKELKANGMSRGAISVAERVLTVNEKIPGKPDHAILLPVALIASAYSDQKQYQQAQPYYERAIQILERNSAQTAELLPTALYALGKAYYLNDDFTKAEAPMLRALSLYDKQKGTKPEAYEDLLSLLGNFYNGMRRFAKAEEMFQRLNELAQGKTPINQLEVAHSLINLANVSHSLSNDAKSIQMLQSAQAALEKGYGKESPVTLSMMVTIWSLLAHIYTESPQSGSAEYAQAEQYYRRIETLYKKTLPADSPGFGELYLNYALLYFAKDDLDTAEAFLKRAVPLLEKSYDQSHPDYALLLNNLAAFDNARGRYAEARAKYVQVRQIMEKAYGPTHFYVGMAFNNLALVYEAEANIKEAVKYRGLANRIYEQIKARTMGAGSEEQKSIYMGEAIYDTDYTVSLHAQSAPADLEAARTALTAVLGSKGRILDVMTDTVGVVRRRLVEQSNPGEQDRALLEEWSEKRAQLAALVFQLPAGVDLSSYKEKVDKLDGQVQQLETRLSARGSEILTDSQPVTIEAVQKLIPRDAILIEYVLYHPFDLKSRRFGPPRYVAYVLSHDGDPKWVILKSDAATIDAAISSLREGLKNAKRAVSEVMRLARTVDEMVMRPVRAGIGGKAVRLLLSPDGQLNLIPFGALVDEDERYLAETYSITYLSSGRDLIRLQAARQNKRGPLIVASPDFNSASSIISPGTTDQATVNQQEFTPLATTREEVKKLLPGAEVLFGAAATKAAVKQIHGPRILHVLTHGVFAGDSMADRQANRGLAWAGVNANEAYTHAREKLLNDPMLNSYLALAGAKQGEAGKLRALELASFDLWGTQLVVLSACETGVGAVQNGEGVYGLRRALVIAGSESQIISLWKVAEPETQRFFEDYYDRLLNKGRSRSEALREVQSLMIQNANLRHPYYWAAFIQSGAWEGLEGKR